MKKLLGALAVALCLVGCGKGPDKAALNFFEALRDSDFTKAAEYAAKDTKPMINMMAAMATDPKFKESNEANELKGVEFKVLETKVDGDTAKVKMEAKKDGKAEAQDIDLVKEDGEWKVKMKKD